MAMKRQSTENARGRDFLGRPHNVLRRNTGTYRPDLSKNCTINLEIVPTQCCYQKEHRQVVYNNSKRLTSMVEATCMREIHGNVSYWNETHAGTQTRNCKVCTDPALIVPTGGIVQSKFIKNYLGTRDFLYMLRKYRIILYNYSIIHNL